MQFFVKRPIFICFQCFVEWLICTCFWLQLLKYFRKINDHLTASASLWLMCLEVTGYRFSANFCKGDYFYDFLCVYLYLLLPAFKGKAHTDKGGKHITNRSVSSASVSIPIKKNRYTSKESNYVKTVLTPLIKWGLI